MKIKIDETQREAIETALRDANGKAEAHTCTTMLEALWESEQAEKALAGILPKSAWPGARYTAVSGDKLPNSYDYAPIRTTITVERGSRAWYLVDVIAEKQNLRAPTLTLTKAQDERAVETLRRNYAVAE